MDIADHVGMDQIADRISMELIRSLKDSRSHKDGSNSRSH